MPTLLVHETKPEFIKRIMDAYSIFPAKNINTSKKSKRYLFTYLAVLFNHISLFPSNIKSPRYYENKIILFFDSEVLHAQHPICFSPTWRFGDCSKKDSLVYDDSISPEENISLWEDAYKLHTSKRRNTMNANILKLYKPMESYGQNELVFKDPIPLTYCRAIFDMAADYYVPSSILLLKTTEELEEYLKENGYIKKLGGSRRITRRRKN